jgi:hypothetical protein
MTNLSSAIRRFNRFELKYLLPLEAVKPSDDGPNVENRNPRGFAGRMGRGNHLLEERFLNILIFSQSLLNNI